MQICQIHSVTFNGFIIINIISLHNYIIYFFIYFGTFYLNMAFFSVIHLPERNTVIQYNA